MSGLVPKLQHPEIPLKTNLQKVNHLAHYFLHKMFFTLCSMRLKLMKHKKPQVILGKPLFISFIMKYND